MSKLYFYPGLKYWSNLNVAWFISATAAKWPCIVSYIAIVFSLCCARKLKKKKKTPSKPTDGGGLFWPIQTASRCWGPALSGTLLGHCKRTVKNLIMALMPYCLWRHKAMFLHLFHLHVFSVVSLVLTHGVWKRLCHICRPYMVRWLNIVKQ